MGGSFHIAPGKSFSLNHIHIHDVHPYSSSSFNLSHIVRHLSFGERINFANTHPLDGMEVISKESKSLNILSNIKFGFCRLFSYSLLRHFIINHQCYKTINSKLSILFLYI